MRKLLVAFVLLLLVACSNSVDSAGNADAIISEAKLTEREQILVELLSEQCFLFELKINNSEVSEIYTTIDYYENGELVKTILEDMRPVAKDEHDHINLLFSVKEDEKHQQWMSAILIDGDFVSSDIVIEREDEEELRGTATSQVSSDTAININEKRVIASIVKTNKDVVTSRVDIATEEEIKQATNYEEVYLISIELK